MTFAIVLREKRTSILTILAILFITLASQAKSDTVMKCERKMDSGKMDVVTFKLGSSLFSSDKILRREDGGWSE